MALKIRKGPNTNRLQFVPELGELIYVTDTKELFVGDGVTTGGNKVSGGLTSVENDIAPKLGGDLLLNENTIAGTGNIDIIGSIISTDVISDFYGTLYDKNSQLLINGEDRTFYASSVYGNLISGNSIENGDVKILLNENISGLEIDAVTESFYLNEALSYISMVSSRGTRQLKEAVENFDYLGGISFSGWSGEFNTIAASIYTRVCTDPVNGVIPGRLIITTQSLDSFVRNEFTMDCQGVLTTPILRVGSLDDNTERDTTFPSPIKGTIFYNNQEDKLQLYVENTFISEDGSTLENGWVNIPVEVDGVLESNVIKTGVYINNIDRDNSITPEPGMIIYNSQTHKYQGYVEDIGDSTPGWVDLH